MSPYTFRKSRAHCADLLVRSGRSGRLPDPSLDGDQGRLLRLKGGSSNGRAIETANSIAFRKLPNRRRMVFSDGRIAASVQVLAVGCIASFSTNSRIAAMASSSAEPVSQLTVSGLDGNARPLRTKLLWRLSLGRSSDASTRTWGFQSRAVKVSVKVSRVHAFSGYPHRRPKSSDLMVAVGSTLTFRGARVVVLAPGESNPEPWD